MREDDKKGKVMEDVLHYANQPFQLWHMDSADGMCLWMTDETFQRYVMALLATQGITAPTNPQLIEAVERCRKYSYWFPLIPDPEVHVSRKADPRIHQS